MSLELVLQLTDEQLEIVAERTADLIAQRSRTADAPERWLTVKEAAEHLACPTSRIYSLVSAGRIPHAKDGTRTLFRRSELDEFVRDGGARRP